MSWRIENPIETIVGAAVLVAAGFFAYVASQAGGGAIGDGYRVKAAFSSASGVSVGTDVRVAGVKVGRVSGLMLDQDTYFAAAELTLKSNVKLPIDSLAKVASENLLGGAYIALEPGIDDELLAEGDVIEQTQGAADLLDLLQQFSGSGGGKTGEEKSSDAGAESGLEETVDAAGAADDASLAVDAALEAAAAGDAEAARTGDGAEAAQ